MSSEVAKVSSSPKTPHYNWRDIPEYELRKGVIQKNFRGDRLLISYNYLHPGMATSPHSHDFEQVFMLLEGRVRLHLDDEVLDCGPGTVVRIPPNVVHWAEPPRPEDGVALNVDLYAPIRPERLKFTSYQTDKFTDA